MKATAAVALLLSLLALALPSQAADPGSEKPRHGKYTIYAYGAVRNAPIYLGYFVLSDGSYKAYLPGDKVHGEGKYSYNSSAHEVTWESGPYASVYGGTFTVEMNGKRHQLRLKSTTVAGNDG